jgi:GAF domain-containing protein
MLYPAEDNGNSLAGMAQRDLHASLQLLAERAQYITGASGAAIALRRDGHNDMLCHASAGSNAPELGALLSAESGLSGESVRTRQPLRCDDAESDPRVNRQSCRELGIASVVVMPIVSEDQVLGVFELFSGRPKAFDERDLSALQRLGEMVETAVQHGRAAGLRVGAEVASDEAVMPVASPPSAPEPQISLTESPVEPQTEIKTQLSAEVVSSAAADLLSDPKASSEPASVAQVSAEVVTPAEVAAAANLPQAVKSEAPPVSLPPDSPQPKRTILWSAPATANSGVPPAESSDSIAVPPALRNVHRCQACGFPVSEGRVLCVDCEEKKWRGEPVQRRAKAPEPPISAPAIASRMSSSVTTSASSVSAAPAGSALQTGKTDIESASSASSRQRARHGQTPVKIAETVSVAPHPPRAAIEHVATETTSPGLFLSAGMESQSWWAANKYVLAAVSIVGIVIALLAWMR